MPQVFHYGNEKLTQQQSKALVSTELILKLQIGQAKNSTFRPLAKEGT